MRGPVHEHGGHDRCARAARRHQPGGKGQLDDTEPARAEGHGRRQAGELEHREDLGPADRRRRHSGRTERDQKNKEEGQVADRGRSGEEVAAGGQQFAGMGSETGAWRRPTLAAPVDGSAAAEG